VQSAETEQAAVSSASADQNAVNANVPVNVAGGSILGGSNSANQEASNNAESGPASNGASTTQSNSQTQEAGGSSCTIGCGGAGQSQESCQTSSTEQAAVSSADADQNVVNANVPVNIAGGSIIGGSNSAEQKATNGATSGPASNSATTNQSNSQTQEA
jgi:hypothetical protein